MWDWITSSLDRATASLSGGESQRIRLATQIGSKLVNVLYILDEPSIGLHQRDNRKLIHSLKELRDEGNSVMVVEHDAETMYSADWLVDVGPGAGENGGKICVNAPVPLLLGESGKEAAGDAVGENDKKNLSSLYDRAVIDPGLSYRKEAYRSAVRPQKR